MSDQKNWDAALIKTWRLSGMLKDTFRLFYALSGKLTNDCDPPLKRMPPDGMPGGVGVRVFVAEKLPKISERLWEQTPDKDVLLLRKLETSIYDTMKQALSDPSMNEARSKVYRDKKRNELTTTLIANRNHSTDWGVTKGARSKMGGR